MAIGDIWRVAMVVRTVNSTPPDLSKFFEWVVVYHYEVTGGFSSDDAESADLIAEQVDRQTAMTSAFAGVTTIVEIETLNLSTFFNDVQAPDIGFGTVGNECLPPQVAVAVSGRGATLGRRALKYWASIDVKLLGANGVLIFGAETDALLTNTFRSVVGFSGSTYEPTIFGEFQIPDSVIITSSKLSPSWRTQRRRVLDFKQ